MSCLFAKERSKVIAINVTYSTSSCLFPFRCAVDDTVEFIQTQDKRIQRFKLEAFKFVGDHQFVYMHCKVIICNATDDSSRCAQGCVRRGKRSLITQESKHDEYMLAQGPFMRAEEEEPKLDETVKDMRDEDKSGKFVNRRYSLLENVS